jgi:hexulose-6-phosphate isomerase
MTGIGVMQGRLLPRIDGRIQAFPWTNWRSEFETARAVGFDSIEFIFEGPAIARHPLMTPAGRDSITSATRESGVRVGSICADYFMDEPLFRGSIAEREQRRDVLSELIGAAADVGASFIEIPCVDRSSLKSERERSDLVDAVSAVLPVAVEKDVGILLETDLPPSDFRSLLDRWGHPLVGANFDSGNSASLGYEPRDEIATLGETIRNVHIKDRLLGGTTVPLGTGAARFDDVFASLGRIGYAGSLILQTARDEDDVGAAVRYLGMVREWSDAYLGRE